MARRSDKTEPVIDPATNGSGAAPQRDVLEASIGGRIEFLRKEHRFSIRRLAERAGVSASLISDVERGKVEPSISTLKRLSNSSRISRAMSAR